MYDFFIKSHFFESYIYEGKATVTPLDHPQYQTDLYTFPETEDIIMSISIVQFILFLVANAFEVASTYFMVEALINFALGVFISATGGPFLQWLAAIFFKLAIKNFVLMIAMEIASWITFLLCNSDPIEPDYDYLKNRLKDTIPLNDTSDLLSHQMIDNTVTILNTTEQLIINEEIYNQKIIEGDYKNSSEILKDNSELTTTVANEFNHLSNNMQAFISENERIQLEYKEEINQGNLDRALQNITIDGLPSKMVTLLEDIGYTDEEVYNITQEVLGYNEIEKIMNVTKDIKNITAVFDIHGSSFLETSELSLNESINLKTEYLGELITSASLAEQEKLNSMKTLIENAEIKKLWYLVEELSINLMNFSKYIVEKTNNISYLEYYNFANSKLQYVRLMLSLDLIIPLEIIQIKPGVRKDFNIPILNKGNETITCDVIIESDYIDWILYDQFIELDPFKSENINMSIYVPKDHSIPPTLYPVNITIIRRDMPEITNNDQFYIEVLPFYDFEVILTNISKTQIIPGESVDYNLVVGNTGNIKGNFHINFSSYSDIVDINLPQDISFTLEPGEINNLSIQISLSNDWIGITEIIYSFNIDIIITDSQLLKRFVENITIIPTLQSSYRYVQWQIEELKIYIINNINYRFSRCLKYKLSLAQDFLQEALYLVEDGSITCGLIYDKKAKIFIYLTEIKVKILSKFNKIGNEHRDFIIEKLLDIRNNIVVLMGISLGMNIGNVIANIEIDLLKLLDLVNSEIYWRYARRLSNLMNSAAKKMEMAMIKISYGVDPLCSFKGAQWKLDCARYEISRLLRKNRITNQLADIILAQIDQIDENIEELKN